MADNLDALLIEEQRNLIEAQKAKIEQLTRRVEELTEAFENRIAIYRHKRDEADALADNTYNRYEAFDLVVEAFECFASDAKIARASLSSIGTRD